MQTAGPSDPAPGPAGGPPTPGRSLAQAVGTGIALLGLLAVAYAVGPVGLFALISAIVLVALFEMLDALARAGHRPRAWLALGCGAAMLVLAYLEEPRYIVVALAAAMYGSFFASLLPGRGRTPATDVAWTVLGVAWITGGGAAAVSIMMLEPAGVSLLVAFILVPVVDDIAAYFGGTRFGRHKMAPSISPAKSWEGLAVGSAAAIAAGGVAGAVVDGLGAPAGFGLGIVCAVTAPVGDLVESVFKRELGIKDSSRFLPGHGGALDRLDALVFSAPAAYLYLLAVTG